MSEQTPKPAPMTRLVDAVRRGRLVVIGLCAALTIGAALLLPRLAVETDFLNFLPRDDADLSFFKEVGEIFGGTYTCIVTTQSPDVFTTGHLGKLRKMTRAFKQTRGVTQVMSLTNMMDIRKTENGIAVIDLVPPGAITTDRKELEKLRSYVLSKERYTQAFVSRSGTTAAVIVRLDGDGDVAAVAGALRDRGVAIWGQDEIHFAGFPMLMEYLMRIIWRDMSVLSFLVAGVILLVLYFSFRSGRGVALPLLTVVLATLFSFGSMAASGNPITLISSILPVILFSTGTAYTIHLLNAVKPLHGQSPWGAIDRAVSRVGVAILLSGVTTLVGFLSLLSSPLSLFGDFGLYAAVGVGFALLISLTVIPVILSFLKNRPVAAEKAGEISRADRLLEKAARVVQKRHRLFLAGSMAVVVAASLAIPQLRTEMDMLAFFTEDAEPRVSETLIRKEFGGSTPLSIHLAAPLKDPRVLREMWRLEKRLRAIKGVNQPGSIADLIAEMNEKLNGRRAIPETRRGVASLWLLLEGQEALGALVNQTEDRAMIEGRYEEVAIAARERSVRGVDRALEQTVRPRLASLGWSAVSGHARTALRRRAADEIVDDILLDLAHRKLKLKNADRLREAITRHVGGASPVPSADRRYQAALDYLSSEDCDIEIEPDAAPRLAAAVSLHEVPGEAAYAQAIRKVAPEVAREDEEGVEIAAEALDRIVVEAGEKGAVAGLLGQIRDDIAPRIDRLPDELQLDLRGDLWQAFNPSWPVSPQTYAELTGTQPPSDQVVNIETRQTGMAVMQTNLNAQLRRSQVISLGFALLTVFVLLVIQLRSLVGGLISIAPIVFTLAVNFGIMGLFGIAINPGTMMIAALAIGIGIDYAIHVVTRLRDEIRRADSQQDALIETFRTTGKAVLINVASVAAGFLVITQSKLVVLQQFGSLIALSMVLSAVGALTLIPALILVFQPRFVQRSAAIEGSERPREVNHDTHDSYIRALRPATGRDGRFERPGGRGSHHIEEAGRDALGPQGPDLDPEDDAEGRVGKYQGSRAAK